MEILQIIISFILKETFNEKNRGLNSWINTLTGWKSCLNSFSNKTTEARKEKRSKPLKRQGEPLF